ncbi:hypothetical protein [Stenotrophomonas sp. NRRL B-14846]|uniref:hypothetical protein n=1 Tax=Stenotrophomonas sp. NRRL B-14846 TaxID=3162882 RepID=UPI003D2DF6FF
MAVPPCRARHSVTAASALQWTGGGSEGLAASLQSLSGQAHARAESATFDSIDMSRRAIAESLRIACRRRPRLRGAWQSAAR